MARLDRIEIEGFKSIRALGLDLRPMNVLVGANGAGKSNLISAFGFLRDLLGQRLQPSVTRSGGGSALLHHGPRRTTSIRLLFRSGSNSYETVLSHAVPDRLFFEHETVWGLPTLNYGEPQRGEPIDLGSGHVESRLSELAQQGERAAQWVLERAESWRVYHFHETGPTAPVKLAGNIDDNAVLRADGQNLAAFLYRLREDTKTAPYYRRIIEAVRLVAPFFDDLSLRPSPLSPRTIQLEWTERGSDAYFNANSMSDGTLRFLCLATLLLQPAPPSLIIIDEPELGLHPFAIAQLAAMLQSVTEPSDALTQVLLATQSVTLINQFGPDDVIVVDRRAGQSEFRRPEIDEVQKWLAEYALGELWEKNVIGGRPRRQ